MKLSYWPEIVPPLQVLSVMSADELNRSDDSLFEEIGSYATSFSGVESVYEQEAVDRLTLGLSPRESTLALGKQIYIRVVQEMYGLFCGSAKTDRVDRDNLLNASGLTSSVTKTLVTGLIVKYLGLAAALAAVIATLFCKRILVPAGSEVCKFWGEKLTL